MIDYHDKNRNWIGLITLETIKDLYLKEPNDQFIPRAARLIQARNEIDAYIRDIDDEEFFFEVEPGIELFRNYRSITNYLKDEDKQKILQLTNMRIFLCKICDSLFKKAASIAYNTKEANDYDDDDDDD